MKVLAIVLGILNFGSAPYHFDSSSLRNIKHFALYTFSYYLTKVELSLTFDSVHPFIEIRPSLNLNRLIRSDQLSCYIELP